MFGLHLRPRIRRLTTSACFRKSLKTRSPHSNCGLICRVCLDAFSPPSPTDFTLLRCFEFSQNLKKSPPEISSWPLDLNRGYSLLANSLQKTSWKSNKMQSIKRWLHAFISDSWISRSCDTITFHQFWCLTHLMLAQTAKYVIICLKYVYSSLRTTDYKCRVGNRRFEL